MNSQHGEKPAVVVEVGPGEAIEQTTYSGLPLIVQVGFVIGTFEGQVRLEIVQHDKTVFSRDYDPVENSEMRVPVDRTVDPDTVWTLRLVNLLGTGNMPVWVKGGLDDVRTRVSITSVPPKTVDSGLSGSVVARGL